MTREEAAQSPSVVEDLLTIAAYDALKADPEFDISSGWIEDQLRTLTQVGVQVAGAALTAPMAGPAVAMGDMFLMITGASFEQYKQQNPNISDEDARLLAMSNALVQTPFEQIGITKLTKFLLSEIAGTEFVTEFLQSIGPDTFFSALAGEDDKDGATLLAEVYGQWEGGWKETLLGAGKEATHAALASLMFGGVAAGKRYRARKKLEAAGITPEMLEDPKKMDPETRSKVDELIADSQKATRLAKEKAEDAKSKGKKGKDKRGKKFTLKKSTDPATGGKRPVIPAEEYEARKARGEDMSGVIKAGATAKRVADAAKKAQADIEAQTQKPVVDRTKQAWGNFLGKSAPIQIQTPTKEQAPPVVDASIGRAAETQDQAVMAKVQKRFDKAKTIDDVKVDAVGAEGTTLPAGMVQVTVMREDLKDERGIPPTFQVSISNAVKETKVKVKEFVKMRDEALKDHDAETSSVREAYMRAELKENGVGTKDLTADQVEEVYHENNMESTELAKLDHLSTIVGLPERHPDSLKKFRETNQTDLVHPGIMLLDGTVVPSSKRVPGKNFSKRTEEDDIALEEAYKVRIRTLRSV
jgi:hypothetical protein